MEGMGECASQRKFANIGFVFNLISDSSDTVSVIRKARTRAKRKARAVVGQLGERTDLRALQR
jgi:hypothetical protein